MNIKRYLLSVVCVFLILSIADFLFDFFIFRSLNRALSNVWRPDGARWLEPLLYLFSAIIFVYLFKLAYKNGVYWKP